MKKNQSGFTLIELIMVIVILGILSAFALPRFADLTNNARESVIDGTLGAIKSGANIVHAKSLVEGKENSSTETTTVEGNTVDIVYGYPAATETALNAFADISGDYTYTETTNQIQLEITGFANCNIVYQQASGANSGITITEDTSGC